ncbi:MAG: type II toxin-antitoxin system VapC family toxin [Planctomycetes bacterium]|nr:type II toxin-antitoxin system VapC family toxin [Planctomycetota bacterium]MBL7039704.1 type II toxin-antitoxin system VapC family toxin [Pirellulaceae bacterium]
MKLLLDTHTFLWMDAEPTKLSATASSLIVDPGHGLTLSVASLWEIQIKSMLGKLSLRVPLPQMVHENERRNGLEVISITADHVYALDQLPRVHNDPFDRLIAAVARTEAATLLSADPVFRQYPVSLQW